MTFYLEGHPVEISKITYNDGLNFGRFTQRDAIIKSFQIKLPLSHFMKLLEPQYNIVLEDIKADDKHYNDSSDFKTANYCSLNQLLNKDHLFKEIFKA
jgi:hypothetical protein